MTKWSLELDLTPEFIELVDSIRGDTPFSDYLSECMQRGFIAALKEARPDLRMGGKNDPVSTLQKDRSRTANDKTAL